MCFRRERLLGVGQDAEGNTGITDFHICSPGQTPTPGFAIRLSDHTDLGIAMLIVENDAGSYLPLAPVFTIAEKAKKGAKPAKAGKAQWKPSAAEGTGRDGSNKATVLALMRRTAKLTTLLPLA